MDLCCFVQVCARVVRVVSLTVKPTDMHAQTHRHTHLHTVRHVSGTAHRKKSRAAFHAVFVCW